MENRQLRPGVRPFSLLPPYPRLINASTQRMSDSPTIFSGLKTSEAFKKMFRQGDAPSGTEGASDDPRQLQEAVAALQNDSQQLATWVQDQQKSIVKLRRQVGRLSFICLLGVIFYGVSVYWVSGYFHGYTADRNRDVSRLEIDLKNAHAQIAAQKTQLAAQQAEFAALAARVKQVEVKQAEPPPVIPMPELAPAPVPAR